MKRIFCLILALGMLFCLCACGDEPAVPTSAPSAEPTSAPTLAPKVTPKPRPTPTSAPELTPEPTPAPTPTPTPTPEKPVFKEYLVVLGEEIHAYDGPSYDEGYTGFIVGEKGSYTIVEERWDDEGNLWGRLKSGAGWVDLTALEAERPGFREYVLSMDAMTPVFFGPGYDEGYVGVMGEKGIYTIVEERRDYEGNLWGRLKSGFGWVDLTALKAETMKNPPLRVCFAEDLKFDRADYAFVAWEDEFAVELAFMAGVNLQDIRILSMTTGEYLYEPDEVLYRIERMEAGEILVLTVGFPGDFSSYGISCTDEVGRIYDYVVYLSGRNGEPVLQEYAQP